MPVPRRSKPPIADRSKSKRESAGLWKAGAVLGAVLVVAGIGFGLALVAMTRDPPMPVETASVRKVAADSTPDRVPMRRQARSVPSSEATPSPTVDDAARSDKLRDDSSALELTDPRWARDVAATAPAAATVKELGDRLRGTARASDDPAAASTPGQDSPQTDAQSAAADPVGDEQTGAIPAPGRPLPSGTTAAQPTRTARVNSDVRMRARADNGAAVVTTVADGATVGIVDCKGWCEIVYGGKRGFIAARFIETPTASITRARAKPAARAATAAVAAPAPVLPPIPPATVRDLHR